MAKEMEGFIMWADREKVVLFKFQRVLESADACRFAISGAHSIQNFLEL